jgi:hypothetical protein
MPVVAPIVLGYDARERWVPRERTVVEAAETFLLRPDVKKVLSADSRIWPSIFRDASMDIPKFQGLHLGSSGLERPKWIGPLGGPWEDLALLLRCAGASAPERPYTVVALSALYDSPHRDFPWYVAQPPALDERWRLIGYDVTDQSLLSGLTDCGVVSGDMAPLRARWAGHLNDAHLFDDLEVAEDFRNFTDERVNEHAPFYVIGLWELIG